MRMNFNNYLDGLISEGITDINYPDLVNPDLMNGKRTVLIVDDDPDSLILERKAVSASNVRVVTVSSIREALRFLRVGTPDMIITDLTFSGRASGFGLLSYIRKKSHLCAVPVFVVSGSKEQSMINKAMSMGALDYLVKPFMPEKMSKWIESY